MKKSLMVLTLLVFCLTGFLPYSAQAGFSFRWNYLSGSEGWTPQNVSLGLRGTQIVHNVGPYFDHTRLFSAYDPSVNAAPVWDRINATATFHQRSAAAEMTPLVATLHDEYASGSTTQHIVKLYAYHAASVTPVWTYTFSTQTNGHDGLDLAVTKDGGKIVVTLYNQSSNLTEITVFNANSPAPIWSTTAPMLTQFRASKLAADGSRLFLISNLKFVVVNLNSHILEASQYIFEANWGGAISGDGSLVSYGIQSGARVFQKNNSTGNYDLKFSPAIVGAMQIGALLAFSDDNSTLVTAYNDTSNYRIVTAKAYDVAASLSAGQGIETMSAQNVSTDPTLQNTASALAISQNGSRFALGTWGGGGAPEVSIYSSHQNSPLFTYDLVGSVMAIAMSGDGRSVAVASKGSHANQMGGGGAITYFADEGSLKIRGIAHLGQSVSVQVTGGYPGSVANMLHALTLANPPTFYSGIGMLLIERNGLNNYSLGHLDSQGETQVNWTPALSAGQIKFVQGFMHHPRALLDYVLPVLVYQ